MVNHKSDSLYIAKKNDDSKGYREPQWDEDGVGKVSKSSLYRGVDKGKTKQLNPESTGTAGKVGNAGK